MTINKDDLSKGNFKLSKEEILRGYNIYQNVIQNSVLVSSDFLKAFVNSGEKKVLTDIIQSPPVTVKVKVGFIIAKKKIKQAYQRNRLKRLLRESYRLNKHFFSAIPADLKIIFSLSEQGYDYFRENPKMKLEIINHNMIKLQKKILKQVISN